MNEETTAHTTAPNNSGTPTNWPDAVIAIGVAFAFAYVFAALMKSF